MSRSREPGAAQRGDTQAVAPDLTLVKHELDAEEYAMSQHGQEQAPLPDLSAVKYEIEIENYGQEQHLRPGLSPVKHEIDIEEHDLLQQTYNLHVEQGSQPSSSARVEPSVVKVEAGALELGAAHWVEPQSVSRELLVKTESLEYKEESQTAQEASNHSAIVGGIRIKIEERCLLYHSEKLFSSKVVLRDCAAELQQSGRYCQECRVQFSSCSTLAEHDSAASNSMIEALEKANIIKCNMCDYITTKYSSLRRHILRHTEKKLYKCDQCQLSCSSSSNLKVHMRIHTGEKPYECDQCQYRFTSKSIFLAHMRIHTGEKPYKCDQCQFSTSRQDSLVIHKRTHTGEKPFRCNQCEYGSNSRSRLSVHMKAHRKGKTYRCNQRQFITDDRRKNHTDGKPYKCDQCLYSSTKSSSLALHKWTHIKTYRCNQYVNGNAVLFSESARAVEGLGCPMRPPVTKTYSRLARK